jgi:hypothetical protein
VRENDPAAAKLRIKISYVQNEVLKWDTEVNMLVGEIKNDAGILTQVRIFIDQLRSPFGFLKREVDAVSKNIRRQDSIDAEEDKKPDHKYFAQEKEAEAAIDKVIGQL